MSKKQLINILFLGTPQIAIPTLEALHQNKEFNLCHVGILPRNEKHPPSPVEIWARRTPSIRQHIIHNNDELLLIIQKQKINLVFVVAFGMMIGNEVLKDVPCVNVHFSLLPKYRGASPVQSAIRDNADESGITWQVIDKKLDTGDIIDQYRYRLAHENCQKLFEIFAKKTAELSPNILRKFFQKEIIPQKQDPNQSSYCKKLTRNDGLIDPQKETAEIIYRKFLAYHLFPQIHLQTKTKKLKITDVSLNENPNAHPLLCAKNTKLYINRAQIEGKKELSAKEILRGNSDAFTSI